MGCVVFMSLFNEENLFADIRDCVCLPFVYKRTNKRKTHFFVCGCLNKLFGYFLKFCYTSRIIDKSTIILAFIRCSMKMQLLILKRKGHIMASKWLPPWLKLKTRYAKDGMFK